MNTQELFPKNLVPQSTFIIEGIILKNNSINLKQDKITPLTFNQDSFDLKNPKQDHHQPEPPFKTIKMFKAISNIYAAIKDPITSHFLLIWIKNTSPFSRTIITYIFQGTIIKFLKLTKLTMKTATKLWLKVDYHL